MLTVYVDFDGTLAKSLGKEYDYDKCGEPVKEILDIVKILLNNGDKVVIFTARVYSKLPQHKINASYKAIREWCITHIGQPLEVTAEKSPEVDVILDDRSYNVIKNIGLIDGDFWDNNKFAWIHAKKIINELSDNP